jgi:hypothetical protein
LSGVAYHAWTHRPKAEGGTDPIEVGTTDLPWARISRGYDAANLSVASGSYTGIDTNHAYNLAGGDSSAGVFELHSGTPDTIEILVNGIYAVTVWVSWFDLVTTGWYMGFTRNVGFQVMDYTNALSASDPYQTKTFILNFTGPNAIHLAPMVYHAAGAARNLDAAFLHVVKLGDYTGTAWTAMNADL